MANVVQNPSYACISSWEAADIVSQGNAGDKAALAKSRVADLDLKVSKRRFYFLVAQLKAQGKRLGQRIV